MNELLSLKDKNYALSGGTGTLGGSIAKYLVENGAKVLLLGRSIDKLKEKQNELNKLVSGSTFIFKVDVMDEEELTKLKNQIKEEFEHLDGLVNLAGGNIPGATLKPDQTIRDIAMADTRKVVDINLFGTVIPSVI